jgi:adenosine kinase
MLEKYGIKANDAILAEEKHMGIYEDRWYTWEMWTSGL